MVRRTIELFPTSASKLHHWTEFREKIAHDMSTVDFYQTNTLQIERIIQAFSTAAVLVSLTLFNTIR